MGHTKKYFVLNPREARKYFVLSPREAQERWGHPENVLIRVPLAEQGRVPTEQVEALTLEREWVSLLPKQKKAERWVEVELGAPVPDGPEVTGPPVRRRFPLEVLARWPQLQGITIPDAPKGSYYSVRVIPGEESGPFTLKNTLEGGSDPSGSWSRSFNLAEAVTGALQGIGTTQDPHLVVGVGEEVQLVVSLETGRVEYAREEFPEDLIHPYRRSVVVCPVGEGRVWAVRPRGKDFWALPGGHLEVGESSVEAATREMLEETGVRVLLKKRLGTIFRPWSTTEVFLGEEVSRDNAPNYEEVDAVVPVLLSELEPTERLWLQRRGFK